MVLLKIKWFVIINPISGGGKAVKLWKKLRVLLEQAEIEFEFAQTKYPNHAFELTQAAMQAGALRILIIGGDGTANEVVNGLMQYAATPDSIALAMISVGTGNDWVRTIGKPASFRSMILGLKASQTFAHDVGVLEYAGTNGRTKRYFINIAGLGFDGYVAYKLSRSSSFFSGSKIQYWIGLMQSLFTYKHTRVNFTVDDESVTMQTLSVAAGICKYNGGGMQQLPHADFNDGLLDMTVISNMHKLKMILSLPKLASGSFIRMQSVKTFRGKQITIESDKTIHVETDGEYLGTTPVQIHIIPSAIRVVKWK